MWIGGYDDWTPAEQREWDRDLEELEREQEEREARTRQQERESMNEQKQNEREVPKQRQQSDCQTLNKEQLSWMELALDDPLYTATYTRLGTASVYVVDIKQHSPSKQGDRNLMFEIVYPLYQGLNAIIDQRKTPTTSLIKIDVSSREHMGVSYACECTPEQWSYTVMDDILEGLSDELSMKQDLNGGLLVQLTFS